MVDESVLIETIRQLEFRIDSLETFLGELAIDAARSRGLAEFHQTAKIEAIDKRDRELAALRQQLEELTSGGQG